LCTVSEEKPSQEIVHNFSTHLSRRAPKGCLSHTLITIINSTLAMTTISFYGMMMVLNKERDLMMLTPKTIHDDLHEHHTQVVQLFSKYPWLIPATTLLHIIPVAIGVHGFWQSRALSKQLKIEREKTKQLALQQVEKVQSAVASHHCQRPSLHHLFNKINSHH